MMLIFIVARFAGFFLRLAYWLSGGRPARKAKEGQIRIVRRRGDEGDYVPYEEIKD